MTVKIFKEGGAFGFVHRHSLQGEAVFSVFFFFFFTMNILKKGELEALQQLHQFSYSNSAKQLSYSNQGLMSVLTLHARVKQQTKAPSGIHRLMI